MTKDISIMQTIRFISIFLLLFSTLFAKVYFVSLKGDDKNKGDKTHPFKTLQKAIDTVKAGDMVFVREGIYPLKGEFTTNGTKNAPIIFQPYKNERVIFEGKRRKEDKFWLLGSYLVLKNFEIRKGETGIVFSRYKDFKSSHNIIENINFYNHIFGGILITKGASYNLILNCDSHDNFDPKNGGEHADGFAAKGFLEDKIPYIGKGNKFAGCRAYNNSDDGFDLWDAGEAVVIERCMSYSNGFDRWNFEKNSGRKFQGDGSGFKLGRSHPNIHNDTHKVTDSIAWKNAYAGFDYSENYNTLYIYNNKAYLNPINYIFNSKKHILKNNLSLLPINRHFKGIKSNLFKNSWEKYSDKEIKKHIISFDDTLLRGKRDKNGNLPKNDFLKFR